MIGSAAHEEEIMAAIMALKDDPVGFVFYAYKWGEKGTALEHINGPRDWQLAELEEIGKHTRAQVFAMENDLPLAIDMSAKSSGRGPGKSALMGMTAHWHMSTRLGAPTIVTANTEAQLRTRTFPEYATWFGSAINSHWFTLETMKIIPQNWLLNKVKEPKENGGLGIDPKYWYVQGQTWSEENPDSFAGAHNPYGMLVQYDEASGIPSKIYEVTEGFFTEINPYRFWQCMSQMRSRQGRFFELFNDPKIGKGWRLQTLSTRGMANIDQAVVESQIERYGIDSDFVRVEIMGLPPLTSSDQFIPYDNVRAAQQNKFPHDYGEALILGVDPAPRGRTAWRFRQGRNARDCVGPATFGHLEGANNIQIAQKVLDLDNRFKPDHICIDFGLGTGVIDIVKSKRTHAKVHEVKFGAAVNDKHSEWGSHAIELWGRVRDWLPGGMIEKDEGEKGSMSNQLTDRGWRWSGKEEGKKILETKKDLKARGVDSPDDPDALACTMEVDPPRVDRHLIRGGGTVPIAEGAGGSSFFD